MSKSNIFNRILFQMTYGDPRDAGRRKHRHRCSGCRKIVEPGARVFMLKTTRSWVWHVDCLDQRPACEYHGPGTQEIIGIHASNHLLALGHSVEQIKKHALEHELVLPVTCHSPPWRVGDLNEN